MFSFVDVVSMIIIGFVVTRRNRSNNVDVDDVVVRSHFHEVCCLGFNRVSFQSFARSINRT